VKKIFPHGGFTYPRDQDAAAQVEALLDEVMWVASQRREDRPARMAAPKLTWPIRLTGPNAVVRVAECVSPVQTRNQPLPRWWWWCWSRRSRF